MNAATEKRARCLGPLALTAGVLCLVLLMIALPLGSKLQQYRETADDHASQLARFEARLAKRPAIEQALTELRTRSGVQRSYIQGQTLGLGGANLQQLVKTLIERAGGTLISSQITTPPADQPLQMLVDRVRMRGNVEVLLNLAHRIETGEPALFLDNLVVRAARAQRRATDELDIQFDLSGYMLLNGDER